MNRILITTTNNIQDAKILEYLGIVSSNIVVGTNIFSDFVASLSDVFGGTSGTYQKQLQKLYSLAIDDLTEKALRKRANAVVGIRVDFDEISGKGKSMFMVSIVGTAVSIASGLGSAAPVATDNSVSLEEIKFQLFRKKWEDRNPLNYPNEEEWEYIFTHDLPFIAESIYQSYLLASTTSELNAESFVRSANSYFSELDCETLSNVVYKHFNEKPFIAKDFIKKYKLFNAFEINKLLHSDSWENAIDLLASEKMSYTEKDLIEMREIVSFLDNLPDQGIVEESNGGLFSSNKKRYICPNGHKNDEEIEFCHLCNLNIKGLTKAQIGYINQFKMRVAVLSEVLGKSSKI